MRMNEQERQWKTAQRTALEALAPLPVMGRGKWRLRLYRHGGRANLELVEAAIRFPEAAEMAGRRWKVHMAVAAPLAHLEAWEESCGKVKKLAEEIGEWYA